jgi:hypothetical protein
LSKNNLVATQSLLSKDQRESRPDSMDILERAFLAVAAVGIVMLVALTDLLAIEPTDPVPASVLQALNGIRPEAALAGNDLARADDQHARRG